MWMCALLHACSSLPPAGGAASAALQTSPVGAGRRFGFRSGLQAAARFARAPSRRPVLHPPSSAILLQSSSWGTHQTRARRRCSQFARAYPNRNPRRLSAGLVGDAVDRQGPCMYASFGSGRSSLSPSSVRRVEAACRSSRRISSASATVPRPYARKARRSPRTPSRASTAGICTHACICTVRRSGEAAREPTAAAAETLEGAGGGRNGVSPYSSWGASTQRSSFDGQAFVRYERERVETASRALNGVSARVAATAGGERAAGPSERSSGETGRRREAAQAIDRLVVRRE